MSIPNSEAPIIIKRKKIVVAGGHHGGAWKVAYADFVTAMMAFFLLMWLLNATTEEQRKGIADYFDPRIPIGRVSGGGEGVLKGDSVFADSTLARSGTGALADNAADGQLSHGLANQDESSVANAAAAEAEDQAFDKLQDMFNATRGESTIGDDLMSHVRTRVTDEGLIIELFDIEGSPLFVPGTAEPTEKMLKLLDMMGGVIGLVANPIAISGHTDATLFAVAGYSNWELSSNRAHLARRRLVMAGVEADRMERVTGKADRHLVFAEDPTDPRNRRIEITLLRSDLVRPAPPASEGSVPVPRARGGPTMRYPERARAVARAAGGEGRGEGR